MMSAEPSGHHDAIDVQADQHFDVVIVGGGMSGLTLARSLADSDLQIAVVEASVDGPNWSEDQVDPRVSALSEASRALLTRLGAWPEMVARRVTPYTHMSVWDGEGTGALSFHAQEAGVSLLGHIVENSVTVQALQQTLVGYDNVTLLRGRKPTGLTLGDGSHQLCFDDKVLNTALVVACDGAQSRVRDWAGFETREWDYGHHALVTTVQVEQPHQSTAWQRFLPTGPLAFLPITQGEDEHWCSIVWSTSPARAEALKTMPEADFCAELTRAFESRLGQIISTDQRYSVPLRQRHAVDYVKPGVALVADAAHTIHPLAGQGVNLGFLDVAMLSDCILEAHAHGDAVGDLAWLQRYQARRKPDNLAMMAAMEGLKRLFGAEALPLRWLRNQGLHRVAKMPWLRRQLVTQALGWRQGTSERLKPHGAVRF